MRIRVGFEFAHHTAAPVHAVLQVEPRLDTAVAVVAERWDNRPALAAARYVDGFGNLCRRVTLPEGPSTLRYDAVVEAPDAIDPADPSAGELAPEHLPPDVLVFTLPSLYCPSTQLADAAWDTFGHLRPGWGRVQAVVDWVHDVLTYSGEHSTPATTAADVLASRQGVCRDYAHLVIAFLRALNVPARYAFGYLPEAGLPLPDEPPDFCAWVEVHLGGAWWTFDPRNNQRRAGRVLVGRGRDALDVAMVTAFGRAELVGMQVWADQVAEAGA